MGSLDGGFGTTSRGMRVRLSPLIRKFGGLRSTVVSRSGQPFVCQETAAIFIMPFFIRSNPVQSNPIHFTEEANACHLGLKAP